MMDALSNAGFVSSSLNAAPPELTKGQVGNMSTGQIDKVSADFESMFISQMVEQMFGESSGTEAFGSQESSDIYKGMMADEYGKQIAKAGGIGIAAYVKTELLKLQEM